MKAVSRIYHFFRILQTLTSSTDTVTTVQQKCKVCHLKSHFQGARGNVWPVYRNGADWQLAHAGTEGCQAQQQIAFFLKITQKPEVHHLTVWKGMEFCSTYLAKNLLLSWLFLWVCVWWLTGLKETKRWSRKPLKGNLFLLQ